MVLDKSGKGQAQDCKYAQLGADYWSAQLCLALRAHHAGSQGLEVRLQGRKALLRGALLPALGVAQ